MEYFNQSSSLFEITEKYPQTLKVFISNGFNQLADELKRQTFGKALQLGIALNMRQLDYDSFYNALVDAIESRGGAADNQIYHTNEVKIKGLLPCPVRIPLQEGLDGFLEELRLQGAAISTDMKSASMGLDWIKEEVFAAKRAADLDDIYVSAGFDMFFEEAYFGRFIKNGDFRNPLKWNDINESFNLDVQLNDPQNRFGIIAVVPAVFLVNTAI